MLDIFRKPEKQHHINPRFRAYGKARIDIAQRAASRDDWDRLWKKSTYPFPFSWGKSWKQCIEYKVADFPAEVGFFIDILGFPVNAFDPDYAMFTSPGGDFYFSVVPVQNKAEMTAPDSIRLQFMVERIMDTAHELQRRGVTFDQWPSVSSSQSTLIIGSFHTPNGISIDLWGFDPPVDDSEIDPPEVLLAQEDELQSKIFPSMKRGQGNRDRSTAAALPDKGTIVNPGHIKFESDEDEPVEYKYVTDEDE